MKVSVIVPARNEERYIGRCLRALRNQRDDLEIIVVDGASTDRTREIAEEYADAVLVEDRPRGPGAARNMGALMASGDVLAFVDADTVVSRGWSRAVIESIEGGAAGVTGPILPLPEESSPLLDILYATAYEVMVRITFLLGAPHMLGLNVAYEREGFVSAGMFPEGVRVSEDVILSMRVAAGRRLRFDTRMAAFTSARRLRSYGISSAMYYALWNSLKVTLTGRPVSYYGPSDLPVPSLP
ncbi:MAG: hypothetical protein DRO06_01110 [Thermoproteota archaeon]|nr:MAG: hypothetical protein DRO06_01110 [Candidatus Korarchaeota archaeon]